MGLHKILKIVALVLSSIGIVFFAMLVSKGDAVIEQTGEGVDGFMYVAYIMFALVLLFVLVFVLIGIFAGNLKKTLISVGLFLLIGVISFVMASGSIEGLPLVDDKVISESSSRWVGAGLYAFYILGIMAIGAMVFSGIKKLIK
ncbi:MAG: hypothetical protein ACI86C_000717 [Candidatus Latescibacterota bacterium]|jgi:hypothetical protein